MFGSRISTTTVFVEYVDVNAYCIVSCERKKVQTSVVKKSSQPEWNTAAVFYRRTPTDKPVTLEVQHDCWCFCYH